MFRAPLVIFKRAEEIVILLMAFGLVAVNLGIHSIFNIADDDIARVAIHEKHAYILVLERPLDLARPGKVCRHRCTLGDRRKTIRSRYFHHGKRTFCIGTRRVMLVVEMQVSRFGVATQRRYELIQQVGSALGNRIDDDAFVRHGYNNRMNIIESIEAFHSAYAKQNYEEAYQAFCNALEADADFSYRAIAVPSGALGRVAEKTGKVDALAVKLDTAFVRSPHMHLMCENRPEQIEHVKRVREENLAKGKPSVVLVTMEKSGSVSLANIFTSGLNLPSFAYSFLNLSVVESWARDYARGGACYVTHLRPYPENITRLKRSGIGKMIVHTRDPRQAILSWLHHLERYRDVFPEKNNSHFRSLSLDEKLPHCMDMYMGYVQWIEGWCKASQDIDILFSTFEQFVMSRDDFTQRYLDFYGPHAGEFNPHSAFTEHAGIDYHKRLGEIDEWRSVFSPANQRMLGQLLPDALRERFSWPQ
jgi:hypothetical protein